MIIISVLMIVVIHLLDVSTLPMTVMTIMNVPQNIVKENVIMKQLTAMTSMLVQTMIVHVKTAVHILLMTVMTITPVLKMTVIDQLAVFTEV
jgi:hypothetical protein